jgi:hypothetical protein
MWGEGANVISRPVRQKPRYATDHLIDSRNLFCTRDIKLLSTAFPIHKSHMCRKQFVICRTHSTVFLSTDTFPYVCTEHGQAHYFQHPSSRPRVSSYSYVEPYFETEKLTRNACRFVGVRWGVRVKKLSH